MCAVFGILGGHDPAAARRALGRLRHRGPDHCGIVERPGLFFAHRRLQITDPHPRAVQPMRRGGVVLSFNGEIYNFRQLKAQLDFPFQTDSDTEVLIAAYLAWGPAFVERLVGMFAIALLDGDDLYLYRDRFGKKPLFCLHDGTRFAFASEIKALVPLLKSVRMNEDALMGYLSFLAPTAPHTFFDGIHKPEPGTMLHYDGKRLVTKRYYCVLDTAPGTLRDPAKAAAEIQTRLRDAVALRLKADAPVCALLSGGIDSATIAALARTRGEAPQTFTLGYREYPKYDERDNAAQTARLLGVSNRAVEIDRNRFIDASDAVLDTLDEPLNDPAAVPLYLLFKAIAKEGYKVVLSGEGSDELFLGYRQYFEYLDIEKAAELGHRNWLKKYFRAHFSMQREWEWYKRVFEGELLFRTSGEKFTDLQKNLLMRRNVRDGESLKYLAPWRERFERSGRTDPADWYSYVDLMHFQAEHFLVKLDRVSMAHGIESRTPFLDHRLAETVFGIDPSLRVGDGRPKSLLKAVAASWLPETVLNRRKKGFSNPYMEYLIDSGRIALIETVNEQTGLFHRPVLNEYLDLARRGRFKQHVWGLYVLSKWIDRHLL